VLRRSVEPTAQSGHSLRRNSLVAFGQERTFAARAGFGGAFGFFRFKGCFVLAFTLAVMQLPK
jgi:uncharacterized membrane protein YoaK (UPF0700 family)